MEISDRASEKVLGVLLSDVDGIDLSRSCKGDSTCGSVDGAGTNAASTCCMLFATGKGVSTPAC